MTVNDTLIDALQALLGTNIYTHKTPHSRDLNFEEYVKILFSQVYSNGVKFSISGILRVESDRIPEYHISDNLFDPKYDYDFTNVDDKGKSFKRGGLKYNRPCEWERCAIKVNDKYNDTKWLGSTGDSNNDTEWAVSYHGANINFAERIIKDGLKPGFRNVYGNGIYCTPDIDTAEKYAKIFTSPNTKRKYKIVFQNRVKPSSIIECKDKGGPDDFWYIEDGKNMRPYGICIKEIK